MFDTFYTVMVERFRDILGEDWTEKMDAAWVDLLAEIAEVTVPEPTSESTRPISYPIPAAISRDVIGYSRT